VDTDAKKMEHFCDGLKSELYERLNLLEPNSYHELVNKAISQEDAMMKVQKEKKRQNDFFWEMDRARNFASSRRMRMVLPNHPHPASGNFQYCHAQPQVSKPKKLPPRICYNCRQPWHYANECPNPRKNKPEQQNQNPGVAKGNHDKKPMIQVKQGWLNFTGNFLSESIPPYCGLLIMELYSIVTF
jgi:hypothetical protein